MKWGRHEGARKVSLISTRGGGGPPLLCDRCKALGQGLYEELQDMVCGRTQGKLSQGLRNVL